MIWDPDNILVYNFFYNVNIRGGGVCRYYHINIGLHNLHLPLYKRKIINTHHSELLDCDRLSLHHVTLHWNLAPLVHSR